VTVVEIIQPGPWVATNDRHHWSVRAARTKAWRHAAAVYARNQHAQPVEGAVEVHAVIHKATKVHYDLDGAAATVKACVDGLRDAGVIPEDDTTVVARLVVTPGPVGKPGRVVVTVTPIDAEEAQK